MVLVNAIEHYNGEVCYFKWHLWFTQYGCVGWNAVDAQCFICGGCLHMICVIWLYEFLQLSSCYHHHHHHHHVVVVLITIMRLGFPFDRVGSTRQCRTPLSMRVYLAGQRQTNPIRWHHSSHIRTMSLQDFLALWCRKPYVYDRLDTGRGTLYISRPSELLAVKT